MTEKKEQFSDVKEHKYTYVTEPYSLPKETKKFIDLTPQKIVDFLNRNVVGQEETKKALAVAIFSHYRRINCTDPKLSIPKNNVLMQGPTGSGKTFILQNLAKLLDVPFCIFDASSVTENGFKGEDLTSVLTQLYQVADGDVSRAEKGIVYLDEFDKLSSKYGWTSQNGSTVGVTVQRQMLKMLEGTEMNVPITEGQRGARTVKMNTDNILFVCGGAFVGLAEDKRSAGGRVIGFTSQYDNEICQKKDEKKRVTPQDFIDFGLIPEVVGRLPIIVNLSELGEQDLVNILVSTEDSILKKYQNLLKDYDAELVFDEEAIQEIAHQAYVRKTGARGLNAVLDGLMRDVLYEVPSDPTIKRCIITRGVVKGEEIFYDRDEKVACF